MYIQRIAVASIIIFFFIIFPTNPVRPWMSWNITETFLCWDFRMEQGSCHYDFKLLVKYMNFWILCPLWGPLCEPCHSCGSCGISYDSYVYAFQSFPFYHRSNVQCPTEVNNHFRRSGASKAYKRCKACIKLSYVRDNLVPRSPRSCVVLCKSSVTWHALRKVHWSSVTRDVF